MKRNDICWIFLCGLALGACTNEIEVVDNETFKYVSFSVADFSGSRATDTKFDSNDQIGVFAQIDDGSVGPGTIGSQNYATNVPYEYVENSSFVPMSKGIELPENGSKLYYYAIYPYFSKASATFTFAVWNDQTTYNRYTSSDLMIAYTTVSSAAEEVSLTFTHCLSKAVVSFNGFSGQVYNFSLKNVYLQTDVDLNDKTLASSGKIGDIKLYNNGTNSFKAIVPPQTILEGTKFGEMETTEGNYTVVASGDIYLKPGIESEITIVSNDNSRGGIIFQAIQVK